MIPTIVIETTFEELVAFMRTLPDDQPETKVKMNTEISEEARLKAIGDISFERDRQRLVEQYEPEHDDTHHDGSLWQAAYFYATTAFKPPIWPFMFFKKWPWGPEYFKPWKKHPDGSYSTEIDKERCLIKAGALIVAEQDRLKRALERVVIKLSEIQKEGTSQQEVKTHS